MKKLLSILLVAVMVAAMFVPITVSAEGEYTNGQVLFSEDFSDITKFNNLTTTPDPKTGYYLLGNDHSKCRYSGCKTAKTVVQSQPSENGKLVLETTSVSTQ